MTITYVDRSAEQRRTRLLYSLVTIIFGIGISILATLQVYELGLHPTIKALLQVAGFLILMLPIFVLMQAYLEPTLKNRISNQSKLRQNALNDEINQLRSETQLALHEIKENIEALHNKFDHNPTAELIPDELRNDLASEIRAQIERRGSDAILDEIESRASDRAFQALSKEVDFSQLTLARERIETEIFDLGRRGNLNLMLGGITSLVGLIILGISVYFQTTGKDETLTLLNYFLPRAGLALMIQIFAYFFLSLYRNSLQEIKYFQNEVTNIEAKYAALGAAMRTKDNEIIKTVLTSFSTTERNHILLKNQTTVELEKAKAEQGNNAATLKILTEFVSGKIGSNEK
jgi:translation initiation factor 6 (eIF-6)